MYSEDRKGIRPAAHLVEFHGLLQVDGYAGFKRLAGVRDASPSGRTKARELHTLLPWNWIPITLAALAA